MKSHQMVIFGSLSLLALVSCGGTPTIIPTKAVVNSAVVKADKSANLSVSALDNSNAVLRNGALSGVGASVVSVVRNGLTVQAALPTVVATKCGDIQGVAGDITAGILLDASGSMSGTDPLKKRADAAKAFVDRMSGGDRAAVAAFSHPTALVTAPYSEISIFTNNPRFTTDKPALKTAIDTGTAAGGGTPLYESTLEMLDVLKKQGGNNKVAVVLTDGDASNSELQNAINQAKADSTRVFMIALTVGGISTTSKNDMTKIANETNGIYAEVDNATDLNTAFNGVFNATQGAGCINLVLTPPPTAGQTVTGTVNFTVSGVPLSTPYTVKY